MCIHCTCASWQLNAAELWARAGWTTSPGVPMERGAGSRPDCFAIALDQDTIEFVLTDGEHDWDCPMFAKNYTASGRHEFLVKSGNVTRL